MKEKLTRRALLRLFGIGLSSAACGLSLGGCRWLEDWQESPLKKIDSSLVQKMISEKIEIKYSKKLSKIAEQYPVPSLELKPLKEVVNSTVRKWEELNAFFKGEGISEPLLYQNLERSLDLLVLGWTHNYGNRTAKKAAESIRRYLDSGYELNFFLLEGIKRGARDIQQFNQGRITPETLAKNRWFKVPGLGSQKEKGWGVPIYKVLNKAGIELMGLEKEHNLGSLERMKKIPQWTKEVLEERGKGGLLLGSQHINPYLFQRTSFLPRLTHSRVDFIKGVQDLGKEAFISSLACRMLLVELYSQADYSIRWDLLCSLALFWTRTEDLFLLYQSLRKRWKKEIDRMEKEKIYQAPSDTLEKIFPDHEPPVLVPETPPFLNATYIFLKRYPASLIRNCSVQLKRYLQGDYSRFSLKIGEESIKIMEFNEEGKISKIILPA